jgi:uncharacterized tellurite resistance protein B-like protein
MSVFDAFRSQASVALSPKAALALAVMTIIAADEAIEEDDEIASSHRLVRGDDLAFQQAFTTLKAIPLQDCIQRIAATLTTEQKLATLANMLDTAMADRVLAQAEQSLLTAYLNAFQVSSEDLAPIIKVIALKNDLSAFQNSSSGARYCTCCGTAIRLGDGFCSGCGAASRAG